MRVLALLVLWVSSSALAHDGVCQSGTAASESARTAARALEAEPRDLELRLKLADALMVDNCFADAVHVLEEGEPLHARNSKLQSQLREARSMLREQGYFEGLGRAEAAAKLSHAVLRCNKLAEIEACDQALALKPNDPQIVAAKGAALVQAKRSTEALETYRRALQLNPGDVSIERQIDALQAARIELLDTCLKSTGQPALQACQATLIPGTSGEFAMRKRIGTLLQAANEPSAALDSYISANLLQPGDRSVALAIVALSEERKDALALAARGSALLTLGRALDALTPLRQSLALSPEMPEAKIHLAKAESLARQEARRIAVAERPAPVAAVAEIPAVVAASEPLVETPLPVRTYSNAAPVTRSN